LLTSIYGLDIFNVKIYPPPFLGVFLYKNT
jgi:hypothetical protein